MIPLSPKPHQYLQFIFYWRHPSGYEVVSCGLALNSPNDEWCSVSFHRSHLRILGEMILTILCFTGAWDWGMSMKRKYYPIAQPGLVSLQFHLFLTFWFLNIYFILVFKLLICRSSLWTVDENPLLVCGLKIFSQSGIGGACHQSQHLGGRCRWILVCRWGWP